jgi:hypothetical protein
MRVRYNNFVRRAVAAGGCPVRQETCRRVPDRVEIAMKKNRFLFFVLPLFLASCSGSEQLTAPSSPISGGAALTSVSPQGGMTEVSPAAPLSFGFGGPMAPGMEQYFDLHMGGLDGPVMPMTCAWSADRTTLTCNPATAFQAHASYTMHMGGGLLDANGHPVGYEAHGPMLGGQWVQGGMMAGAHGGGMSWGMMGTGWRNANGSYGMAFSFTTGQ